MCDNEPRKPSSRKPAAQCAYAAEVIHLKRITGSEIFPRHPRAASANLLLLSKKPGFE